MPKHHLASSRRRSFFRASFAAGALLALSQAAAAQGPTAVGIATHVDHPQGTVSPGEPASSFVRLEPVAASSARLTSAQDVVVGHTGGLVINPTFDSKTFDNSNTTDQQIESTINTAIAAYKEKFSDPITVNITFAKMSGGLGQSSTAICLYDYNSVITALHNHATTADDALAMSKLPIQSNNPVTGSSSLIVTSANARALGLPTCPASGDSTISLNTQKTTPGGSGPYSLIAVVEHEIDEALGLGSALNFGGDLPDPRVEDLFRYNGSGGRSYAHNDNTIPTGDPTKRAYFSIDGTTQPAEFDNQDDGGDYGDWQSNPLRSGVACQVQDAFANCSAAPALGVELQVLDVIGYHPIPAAPPSITTQPSNVTIGAGSNISFTVGASGATAYQWQISTNGGTSFSNLTDAAPYSGSATAALTITTTPSALTGYKYRCIVSNSAGSVTSNPATLTISGGTSVSPTTLRFAATKAGATGPLTSQTPAQTVSVSFPGTASAWTASTSQSWLQITNGSASRSGQFSVAIVNPGNVIGGSTSLSGTITISAPSSATPTVTVPVTLTIDQTGAVTTPFGFWDTPADGSTGLQGSIPVTGWALDNVGIDHVELWRNCTSVDVTASACAPAPDGTSKVFIGRATIVSGARPDVAQAFPSVPASDQAGFGYLLLTNFLPDLTRGTEQGGNGQFILSAYAVNVGGAVTSLGTKTITVDNLHATQPFGAIDTPAQGATIPGTAAPYNDPNSYPMFAWAMTQNPKCMDPTDLTAYRVVIDGVSEPVSSSNFVAGLTRSDLPAAFPGLCNSNNALAVYYLNATALGLTSGIHTLYWQIRDNGGNVNAIGSRYFNLLTSSQRAPGDTRPVISTSDRLIVPAVALGDASALATLAPAIAAVGARVGDDDAPFAWTSPDATGHTQVQAPLLSRLTLDLDGEVDRGYQRVGDALQALPIGSTLDAATGRFYWQPPVGYLGTFALVFVRGTEQIDVDVTWIDPTAAAPSVAMYVDTPAANGTTPAPLTVAGWALDPHATVGTGIAAVHVWAQRIDAPTIAPVFLGAATLGLARPDVAQRYGAQFHDAGFELQASGLDPGLYDLLIFPWNDRDGRFEAAQVVRVYVTR